jgi:hypothetical protein
MPWRLAAAVQTGNGVGGEQRVAATGQGQVWRKGGRLAE